MASQKAISTHLLSLLLLLLHTLLISPAAAVLMVWVYDCDNVNGNYTAESTYKQNLDALLTKTTSTDIPYGFYYFSTGQSSDDVSLISLCRGDLDVSDCHTCQTYVINQLKTLCPNQKKVIAWSDDCMVRYSSDPMLGVMEETPYWDMNRGLFASDSKRYGRAVDKLLERFPPKASAGNSKLKYVTGETFVNETVKIFAVAQCTPDLTRGDCLKCLDDAVMEIKSRSSSTGQRGARFLFPSCNVRYEEDKFYLGTSDLNV